jgi:signal transduction histidine kinase
MREDMSNSPSMAAPFIRGEGEMVTRVLEFDWASTDLGPIEQWPQCLRTAVQILLNSKFPMFLWWGRNLVNLYNDAYNPVLGQRHPTALGRPAAQVWADIWHDVGPQAEGVMSRGEASWNSDMLLVMERNGYPEETYFIFSYSPVLNEAGEVNGVFCACTETTERALSERRMRALRALAARTAESADAEQVCRAAADALRDFPQDVPFALIYLLDGTVARLSGSAGSVDAPHFAPATVDVAADEGTGAPDPWGFREVLRTQSAREVDGSRLPLHGLTQHPWGVPVRSALVLVVAKPGATRPAAFLVVGLSPLRKLDDVYRGFLDLVAGQLAAAIAKSRGLEEERRRMANLAELDRVKTAFFSNISHEFRTPLTLMLGPIEDLLARGKDAFDPKSTELLTLAHRNALRLLKLVNSLLDFARIQSGRIEAVFEPTDLCSHTIELASVFRAAVERAGLKLIVSCTPCTEPVYVDRSMWEKIAFNLLSNAFKFTFQGEIEVSLREHPTEVELSVRDTGTGIEEENLALVFKRFYRVANARGRTEEGSGIGLSLVDELARLHGGRVAVQSRPGEGSVFSVFIPKGKDHLPKDRIAAQPQIDGTQIRPEAFVEEALRWVSEERDKPTKWTPTEKPHTGATTDPNSEIRATGAKILLVDDNADMRDYLGRLLKGAGHSIDSAPDGELALDRARRHKPDMVLADVMMPKRDGFSLLREMRSDESLKDVPVILLSARAGEAARIEGLEGGATDYVVKPFSATELLARVNTHLKMLRVQREAAEEQRKLRAEAEAALTNLRATESRLRETQLELERHAERLESTVRDRTSSLREAVGQMEEFSYTVSHDLRAPLRAIRGFADVLLHDAANKLTPECAYYLNRIIYNGVRMDKLISDVLIVSRLTRAEIKLEPVALERLAFDIIQQNDALRPPLASVHVGPLPEVMGHEASLMQVLSNLLSNAVKFTRPGKKPEVRVFAERLGEEVRIWVCDNGIGIHPEHHQRVFHMFERVHPDGQFEGTGIGLAIVRKAVERMNGKVGVDSDGKTGSNFWIQLPAANHHG